MAEINLTAEKNKNNLIGSAIISNDTRVVSGNEAVSAFFGAESPVLADYVHLDDKEIFDAHIKNPTAEETFFVCRFKRCDGKYIELSVSVRSIEKDGKEYIAVDMFDIEYMTRQYEKFIASNKIFNELITMSDKIFFRYEVSTKQMYVYNGRETMFDGSLSDYMKETISSGAVEKDSTADFEKFCKDIENGSDSGTAEVSAKFFNSKPQADFNPVKISYSAVKKGGKNAYIVGIYTCAAASSTADSYISNRSNLDPLTNLLNKKAIKDYALEALAKAEKENSLVTFVMMDLDNFKTINDTYGHMFGDETLVSVARIMTDVVGNRGVVGRVGGDEFFIVLTDFPDGDASVRPIIRAIRNQVELCFKDKVDGISVTCSVGTATFPYDAQNYDDLFKLADHCLYVAKSKGRDRYIIYTKELHGTLEDIISSGTVIQMANFISEAHKSKHLLSVIQRFNSAREYDVQQIVLKKVMLELLYYYDVDGVQYCPFDENKQHYETASYKIRDQRALIDSYDGYKYEMSSKGYLTIGNYENAEKEHPVLYDYMVSAGLYSIMIVKDSDSEGNLHGLFVLSTHKRFQKWAAYDINMLLVLCRLMERFVR